MSPARSSAILAAEKLAWPEANLLADAFVAVSVFFL